MNRESRVSPGGAQRVEVARELKEGGEGACERYPMGYTWGMVEIQETHVFSRWFDHLKDAQAQARIQVRLDRLCLGLAGDVKPVGEGVSELRIEYGPGYRVYFVQRGTTLIVLLAGGDKKTQRQDIETALKLARALEG